MSSLTRAVSRQSGSVVPVTSMLKDRPFDNRFLVRANSDPRLVRYYSDSALRIGLWRSERLMFGRHLRRSHTILDVGCGAGRVTFGLYCSGYTRVRGVDLCAAMVGAAQMVSRQLGVAIPFEVGDVLALPYRDELFDAVIFSFNGLMQVQLTRNRQRAVQEIWRVLKPRGCFIFTTPLGRGHRVFWMLQRRSWRCGRRDSRLREFGDVVISAGRFKENYLHFPTVWEVRKLLRSCGFRIVEHQSRNEVCRESRPVEQFARDCMFWVARKRGQPQPIGARFALMDPSRPGSR